MSIETIGTCAYCGGSVRLETGRHPGPAGAAPPPATCAACGKIWPYLLEWGAGFPGAAAVINGPRPAAEPPANGQPAVQQPLFS